MLGGRVLYQAVDNTGPGADPDDQRTAMLGADGYHLVGGVGQYEGIWRMAAVRGPDGFIVNLARRIS